MTQAETLRELLDEHGRTFADDAGITLADKPAPLFQLLVLTSLLSANLSRDLGVRAARALRHSFRTPAAMAEASEDERWRVLSDARYLRKRQTARQLGELADRVVDEYGGDLRRLRDDGDVHTDVQGFTGIGAVGADIFCREVQAVWPSLRPYADDRVLQIAHGLGLPDDVRRLADLAGTDDLSVVGAALVRAARD